VILLCAWVCDRVIGLWMGKSAGLDFLDLPMVKGDELIRDIRGTSAS
jgi:hypothetical protein